MTTHIEVERDTWQELTTLKAEFMVRSHDEVIRKLIDEHKQRK